MQVMPIVYVADPARSETFYRALGLRADVRSRPGSWIELSGNGGVVALHRTTADQARRVQLCLVAEESLERIVERLTAAGIDTVDGITDDEFGRSLRVTDPDGLVLQINEHDRELYV